MSVTVKYKGNAIASANTDTTKTLKTSGKYCEGDIIIENVQDGGITPSGNINIADTNVTDVTNYATAQVVDADLVAENIKKDVNILGIVGSFEGGSGLPSVISKIDGGSFTPASDTQCNKYSIQHNLGEMPKGAIIWCPELMDSETAPLEYGVVYAFLSFLQIATKDGGYTYGFNHWYRRTTFAGAYLRELIFSSETIRSKYVTTTTFTHNINDNYYFSGKTYNWIAWA